MINYELPDGMISFFAIVYRFFSGAGSHHMERSGVTLELGEGDDVSLVRLFAKHGFTIADFKALAQGVCSKGASGTKPCPKCRNVVDHKKAVIPLVGAGLVPFTSTDPASWKPHTDASMTALAEKLRKAQTERARVHHGLEPQSLEHPHGGGPQL